MRELRTSQESLWAGQFGTDCVGQNNSHRLVAANTALFARIPSRCVSLTSAIEFGANIGSNRIALRALFPNVCLSAVEFNSVAADKLQGIPEVTVYRSSIIEYSPAQVHELDRFPDPRLLDHEFVYHRDVFAQDDVTWFLLAKQQAL